MHGNPAAAENPEDEIAALVRKLHETQERLQELTGGKVDAVVHPGGQFYLLHEAQERLRESEEKFRQLAENVSDVFWMRSPDLREVHYVSPAYERTWGRSMESLYANPHQWADAILPEDRERVLATFATLTGEAPTISLEYRIARLDGEIRWVHVRGFQVRNAANKLIRVTGIVTDITERKHSEERVRGSERLLESALDALSAHIAILDETGVIIAVNSMWKTFAETNGFAGRLFGVGMNYLEVCESATGNCAEDAAVVAAGLRALMANRQAEFHLQYACHSAGEQRWFELRATRFAGDGPVRTVVAHENITQRRRADEKLEEAHKQLLETSRRAGMAEVATSVLHSVGNVLNSVNVASSCLADSLRKSKAANLSKVVTLLREHKEDLGTFLTSDPKGKRLPGYLAELAEHLASEQAAALRELAGLQVNIDHIKQIVAMQHSYGKVSEVTQTVKITDLVEDALRMNAGALASRNVQLTREYGEVPLVTIDMHKVLQVLVNLIRNAESACVESGRADKRVTVRVASADDRLKISVIDNGIGIAPENLTRIFSHGFTTPKDGHGSGLHSGALAAKKMGGSLTVHSGGPGQGAMFILELPSNAPGGRELLHQ